MAAGCKQGRVLRVIVAALTVCCTAWPARGETCPDGRLESRAVARVEGAAAYTLDDGSSLKLMSLVVPSARDVAGPVEQWAPEVQSREAAASLVRTTRLEIASAGAFRDRYGRRVAHAFISESGAGRIWLQSALVDAGHARVAPLPGQTLCLRELFAREAVARVKRLGLWANPAYAVRAARETRTLDKLSGTFQIVEGWVADVGTNRTHVFLNFGRDWRWDFTAAVDLKGTENRDTTVARLKDLKGRLVRVRGYIERRNGPFVAMASVEAIEAVPEGSASGR